jgi:16S rRNA U516 pseudouridylate synthase RsuA-like enzyme
MAKERVQKILARAGIASRRKAEEIIVEGGVTINGKIAKLGDQAMGRRFHQGPWKTSPLHRSADLSRVLQT